MMKKKFTAQIEELFRELPDEQKELYIKKYNSQNIIALTIGTVVFIICLVGTIVLFIDESIPLFEKILSIFLTICASGIMFVSIMALKSSDEVKVKRYIESLEKQKTNLTTNQSELNQIAENKYLEIQQRDSQIIEIQNVNKNVISFLQNESLITISKNFMRELNLPLIYLEYVFIPITMPKNFQTGLLFLAPEFTYQFQYPDGLNLEKSPYDDVLQECGAAKQLSNDVALLFSAIARYAGLENQYDIPYKNTQPQVFEVFKEIFVKFQKTRDIFDALYRQGIIVGGKTIYAYYAFIFLLYYFEKLRFTNLAKQTLKELNLSEDLELKELIKECYYKELDDETVKSIAVYVENDRRNNKPLINILTKEIETTVSEVIKEIRDKTNIERLLAGETRKKNTYSIAQIDLMNGTDFENFVADLFRLLGYQAEVTKASGDQGVDVIAKKGTQILAIQAKHYNQPVGNHAIMEVVGGARYYNATICYVVTNSYFTKSAKELAATNNVILWDRDKLIEKLSEI